MLMEKIVIRPMWVRKTPLYAIILATLAVQAIVQRFVVLTLGDKPRTFDEFTRGGPLKIGSVAIDYQLFWVLGGSLVLVALLWLFFHRTRAGRALRACSQNREAAALLGIPVEGMLSLSFALSAALGAFAGVLITPMQFVAYNAGDTAGIAGFIAAVIGGFGNPFGAIVGGIALGVTQSVVVVALGAAYKNVIAFGIMLLVLLVFPQGFFGRQH
jgi:branched-chain amino acid transport system permease protein